jgi:hypothetical protein
MDTYACFTHPIDPKRDVRRRFPLLGTLLTEMPAGFPPAFFAPGKADACMAGTMALAGEGCFKDHLLGKKVSSQQVAEIDTIAVKHMSKFVESVLLKKT